MVLVVVVVVLVVVVVVINNEPRSLSLLCVLFMCNIFGYYQYDVCTFLLFCCNMIYLVLFLLMVVL